jgi:hypothetical protein
MPRSWPSTEAEPSHADSGLRGRTSNRRDVSAIEVEEIDLGPAPSLSGFRRNPVSRPDRPGGGWLIWVLVSVMVAGGVALLPQDAVETPTTAARQLLPTPEIATTTTTLAPATVGMMSNDTFSLAPARGLEGFAYLVGPIQFHGKDWLAASHPYPSSEVTVLSSVDGANWEVESNVSVDEEGWLRVDDIDTFGGVLMLVGSAGEARGPAFAPPTQGASVIWKSTDGRRWSSIPISRDEGSMYLDLTAGSEEVLVTVYQGSAFDTSLMEQMPPELIPGLERGDFDLWADSYSFRVVAPPGIELFRIPTTQPNLAEGLMKLFRSENLIIWEEVDVDFSFWNLATTPDGGFVSLDSYVRYSPDGRSWEPTDRFRPLYYQNWGDRLLGVDTSYRTTNLVVVDKDESATIELPDEIAGTENGLSIKAGAGGLAAIVSSYDDGYAEPITSSDGYILAMDNGVLRIEEPSGETGYAVFNNDGVIPGTLTESGSIRFETTHLGEIKLLEIPVAVLRELRGTPQRGRFDVFLSADGLTWARPQTGLRAGYVEILGYADQGFLIGVHNYSSDSRELPLTVYRTGPVR